MTLKTDTASADWNSVADKVLRHSKTGILILRVTLSIAVGLFVASCAHVPGETLASWSLKRQVSERVLAQASSAAPQCRQQKIANTEIVEVHPDGKPALEIWTVEQCGRRSHYRVYFPPTGRGPGFSVQAER